MLNVAVHTLTTQKGQQTHHRITLILANIVFCHILNMFRISLSSSRNTPLKIEGFIQHTSTRIAVAGC